ncbi:MAG: baseplate J/gp47 family protein [Crocosphaera sp.]|nr:baseplate J/gp47 family protein [Crocosphaera sp.]
MARGRLDSPNLDDRTWQEIVDQAKSLIPTYAPEWTDHNPSDLGITLIELFAWLVEGLTYRLNRVPNKNFIEFLNLIGVTRDPATPASSWLTYSLAAGTTPLHIPKGSQAATRQTETEAAVVFETNRELKVLPINIKIALHGRQFATNDWRYQDITSELVAAPLSGKTFSLAGSSNGTGSSFYLFLGFDNASEENLSLNINFSKPAPALPSPAIRSGLSIQTYYFLGNGTRTEITTFDDETNLFQKNGSIALTVPSDWDSSEPASFSPDAFLPDDDTDPVTQPLFWLGIFVQNQIDQPLDLGINHVLINSVPATNALTISEPELLGTSNGKPFQFFELVNRPLFKQPGLATPYSHLLIQVREPQVGGSFGPWTDWTHEDNFPAGSDLTDPRQGRYFRLNPVTGMINFGNYDPETSPDGHGRIPPLGSEIQALTYRYVADSGAKGNVPPETITVVRTPQPGITGVTNLGPATGGSNEETIEDAKRRGPEILRHRDRAFSAEDFEFLAKEATTDISTVRCLPPRLFNSSYDNLPSRVSEGDPWTYGNINRSVNYANVIIVPKAPLSDERPVPSESLLQEVSAYLDERRVLTSLLHVTAPRYLPINVVTDIRIWQRALDIGLVTSLNDFRSTIVAKITKFLHPVLGGPDQNGWEVGQDIVISNLLEIIQPDTEIGFVATLTVQAATPPYIDPSFPVYPNQRPFRLGPAGVWVRLADYELVCSGTHTVTVTANAS